jgi:UDP-N-acetylmuramoylalanine--D-glutamate ligase
MFSRLEELDEGIVLRGDTFIIKEDGKELPVCTTSEIKLLGSHNHENILAAIGITYYMGVPVEQIRDAVMKFTAVEHRIEYVDTVDGVDYYNNIFIQNWPVKPEEVKEDMGFIMIDNQVQGTGVFDDFPTYDEWIDAFHGKVRYLIVMGATAQAIADTAKNHGFHNVIFADTFEEAMNIAKEKARPGDAVLLSPACASWGMFKNYEVRGKVFKEIVRKFKG